MMTKLMTQLLFAMIFSLSALSAHALDSELLPDIKDGVVTMQMQDPERNVGYVVGDVRLVTSLLASKNPTN